MADWLSVDEAAELSGYNAQHLRRLIRSGQIKAQKKGLMWWIEKKSLLTLITEAGKSEDQRRGPKGHKLSSID